MAEKIKRIGIARNRNFMLYVKDGDVWQIRRKQPGLPKSKPEKVAEGGFEMDDAYIYFIDKDGDVSRARRESTPRTPRRSTAVDPSNAGRTRILIGDSVVVDGDTSKVGIIEGRSGEMLRVRTRLDGEVTREQVERVHVKAVADCLFEALTGDTKNFGTVRLTGESSLADLVAVFGFAADNRLRSDTLVRVEKQLRRAGLNLRYAEPARDAVFQLEEIKDSEKESELDAKPTLKAHLPEPFWPSALGLSQAEDLTFLRSLAESEPILCLLELPRDRPVPTWFARTWEGMLSWAYMSAQRFVWRDDGNAAVNIGAPALLQQYDKPMRAEVEVSLEDIPHRLNLVVLDRESEQRDLTRIKAKWPGPVFRFSPAWLDSTSAETAVEKRALVDMMCLLGGQANGISVGDLPDVSPLALLVWARDTSRALLSAAGADVSNLVRRGKATHFRGSNESGTALALKALAAAWVLAQNPEAVLKFEDSVDADEDDRPQRIDLVAKGIGAFEIETMVGSGPIENFCGRKVLARTKNANEQFRLVVPSHALLWAGPYLADVADKLGTGGCVMIPAFVPGGDGGTTLVVIDGEALSGELDVESPAEGGKAVQAPAKTVTERQITLSDVAGYKLVRNAIEDDVIWARRNPHMVRGCSRAAGILFYGPPGCGKSRLARAICGELEQEVRLVIPSDMKGRYIGWGQHLIREHFDWLFEESNRVLLIDEFDAVARSRASEEMHSDEKADVNEILVQLDKATRRGSMVICTTNYLASLDDAVLRSGRFSHFLPVPPPDKEAAVAIVSYYLDRLGKDEAGNRDDRLQVDAPNADQVRQIVEELWKKGQRGQARLCGADLEAAVNFAYIGAAREMSRAGKAERAHVVVTEERLHNALTTARRSVSVESMERFCEEIQAHSSELVYQSYQSILEM